MRRLIVLPALLLAISLSGCINKSAGGPPEGSAQVDNGDQLTSDSVRHGLGRSSSRRAKGHCTCRFGSIAQKPFCAEDKMSCKKSCRARKLGFKSFGDVGNSQCNPNTCEQQLPQPDKYDVIHCINHVEWINVKIECLKGGHAGKCWNLACWPGGRRCNISRHELFNGMSNWDIPRHCVGDGNQHFVPCR